MSDDEAGPAELGTMPLFAEPGSADDGDVGSPLQMPSILEELQKLRDENRQLRYEREKWAGARKEIERDLASADSDAQRASARIEELERELRRQNSLVEASQWSQEELESELSALHAQLEQAQATRHAAARKSAGSDEPAAGQHPASPPVDVLVRNTVSMLDDLAAAYGAPLSPAPAPPSPRGAVAAEDAVKAQLLADFEATLVEYEAELQRQRQSYQDVLDEKEAEIDRLRLASVQLREAEAEAAEDEESEATTSRAGSVPLAVELSPLSGRSSCDSGDGDVDGDAGAVAAADRADDDDDDDDFFDAHEPPEHAAVLASLARGGGCTLEALLARLREDEPGMDWKAVKLRSVLHAVESRGELLVKIDDENADEPRLLFHAFHTTPPK